MTAWVLRFLQNVRKKEKSAGELTATELAAARMLWVRLVQREIFTTELEALRKNSALPSNSKIARYNPFLDDGLIRLGDRLQCSDLSRNNATHCFCGLPSLHEAAYPTGAYPVVSLRGPRRTIGASYRVRIFRARQTIKRFLHKCLLCKIANNPRGQHIEAPLPAHRLRPSRRFAVASVVFAVPLYIKVGREKQRAYIALFTCVTTRAVHLELCSDMTTAKFLMALQRFIGRQGLPHTVYSDNAKNFQAANLELNEVWHALSCRKTHQFLAQNFVAWTFIAPRAAWWGGWWERRMETTKRCLRKVLGRSSLTEEELNTTLISIEAAVNSRPSTQGGDSDAVTPGHFLIGGGLVAIPTGPEPETGKYLAKEFRLRLKLSDDSGNVGRKITYFN